MNNYTTSIIAMALPFLLFQALSCSNVKSKGTTSTNSKVQIAGNEILDEVGGNGNGRSYDGKIESYQSRDFIGCNGKPLPKTFIEKTLISENTFLLTSRSLDSAGACVENQKYLNNGVITYPSSQLATFDFNLHDKVLSIDEPALNNKNTKIVCKLDLGALVLLDNWLTGLVVFSGDNASSLLWNSRLDFSQISEKTNFLFQTPPKGNLIQTKESLEFRTLENSIMLKPSVYQNMYLKISRPFSDTLSPSKNFGRNTYGGLFQYAYFDYTQSPPFGISSSSIPLTCFVENIVTHQIVSDLTNNSYDFLASLIKAMSSSQLPSQ